MTDLIEKAKLFSAGHKPWAECYPIMREMIAELERLQRELAELKTREIQATDKVTVAMSNCAELRAEVAVWEHRDECWADHVGGVPCATCEQLEQAAEAAEGKK